MSRWTRRRGERPSPGPDLDALAAELAGRPEQILRDASAESLQRTVHQLLARVHTLESSLARANPPPEPAAPVASALDVLLAALVATSAPLTAHPLVSVVMPTYLPARLDLLRSAVDSVLAQSYPHWELLVADNSDDHMLRTPPAWWPDDPRVRIIESTPREQATARNSALDRATGEIIAYLDDDCTMLPWWLRSVVRALTLHPAAPGCFGIRVSEGPGTQPWHVEWVRPDSLRAHDGASIDTNTLAHRHSADLRWDARLATCGDFDLVTRLGADDLVPVPVPACLYGVRGAERVWANPTPRHGADHALARANARARRPLRVLAYNSMYPLVSETYIGDELAALRRAGVELVLTRHRPGPVPVESRVDAPLYETTEEALRHIDPDLVLFHWANVAVQARHAPGLTELPYAVRLHSFDADIPNEEVFDERCIGAWDTPGSPRRHPLVRHLPTLVIGDHPYSTAARDDRVLSVSAGLPKKGWPTLVRAAAESGLPLDVIVATTNGYESVPEQIRTELRTAGLPDTVQVDQLYSDVQVALRRAGAFVYSIAAGIPCAQPRSVIEAALAGTPLVLPDHPALRSLVDDGAHWYRPGDVASLATAMRGAIEAPLPESRRREISEFVRSTHADPAWHQRFAEELTRALVTWRDRVDRGELAELRAAWRRTP